MTKVPLQWSLILLTAAQVFGQSDAPAGRPKFEVASIKPADPDARGSSSNGDGRMLRIKNWTLKRLVQRAFDVQDYQVTGGPNWTDSYRFNIDAKVDESEAKLQGKEGQARIRAMLESLLMDRFDLQFHRETKILPIYNLVPAKNGFKLAAVKDTGSHSLNTNNWHLTATCIDMPALAVYLSGEMERPVLDATGIPGFFNFKLEWSPEVSANKAPDANESTAPSIFTALQEQLGLKLESGKGPVEIIVVDHAEKPTEN